MHRTDHRAARRLGPVGGRQRRAVPPDRLFRRRRRWPRRLAVTGLLAVLLVGPVVLSNGVELAGGAARQAAPAAPAPRSAQLPQPPAPAALAPFARVGDLTLALPSTDVILVGYHEASFPEALELVPVGRVDANDNPTKFTAPTSTAPQPRFVVLSSRGRPHPATSAADLVLRDGDPVRAPVTGRVSGVRPYLLYGSHADTRVEIVPRDRPDLRVVLIHVTDVQVEVGDPVVAGRTPLAASANRFPFASHIDRYLDPERWPHVHLEVKRPAG